MIAQSVRGGDVDTTAMSPGLHQAVPFALRRESTECFSTELCLVASANSLAQGAQAAAPAMIDALWPPKPKLLLITTRSFRWRGVFGV
jgi:hypothetical protein